MKLVGLSVIVKNTSISRILLLVFLVALIPRIAVSVIAPHLPADHWDVAHDVLIARNLAAGHGFANEPGHPTAYRYPLIPLILSAFFRVFGERYIPFLVFQSFAGALTAVILAWIGYNAAGKTLALLTGILVALNTELISFSRMMLTETLFSFLMSVVAMILIKVISTRRKQPAFFAVFLSGVLLGLAALCRPVALGWSILISAAFVIKGRHRIGTGILTALVFLSGSLLAVAPWVIRNQIVMGSPVLTTSGGITFWLFGHNDAERSDDSTVIPPEFATANREAAPRNYFMVTRGDPACMIPVFNMEPRYQAYLFEQSVVDRVAGLDEVRADQELNSMALEYIRAHPFETLKHSFISTFMTFTYTEMSGRLNILLSLIMPFLLLGSYNLWRRSPDTALIVLTCLASMLAVHVVFYFDHRFRVPYQPFFMLLGAYGFLSALRGNLSKTGKILFFGWMIVPVIVNYFLVFGNQSG
jgi:4-amino-4-deoxy-L-arabinose transferase-like glycosyltransferase